MMIPVSPKHQNYPRGIVSVGSQTNLEGPLTDIPHLVSTVLVVAGETDYFCWHSQ